MISTDLLLSFWEHLPFLLPWEQLSVFVTLGQRHVFVTLVPRFCHPEGKARRIFRAANNPRGKILRSAQDDNCSTLRMTTQGSVMATKAPGFVTFRGIDPGFVILRAKPEGSFAQRTTPGVRSFAPLRMTTVGAQGATLRAQDDTRRAQDDTRGSSG
jgi:hypothetical protein